jgi:hypothetical protein
VGIAEPYLKNLDAVVGARNNAVRILRSVVDLAGFVGTSLE